MNPRLKWLCLLAVLLFVAANRVRGEAMLQYFNTDWNEITEKMPELAEAGYSSLWLPPPTKGSGGLSVGYDLWDRFDLGSKDQRGTVRTRYGSEAELLKLVETAHRFGIRVYFDNIMNHNAFDVPGFNADTPIDVYPGMVPEDFHLRVTEDGFYRKWDNTRDWNSAWQVQNLGLADLIDIAHENPNTNFGPNEGDDHPKITFVRQPDHPEYYLDTDLPIPVSNSGGSFSVFNFANKEPFDDIGWGGSNVGAGNGKFDWDDANANNQHDSGEASEPFSDLGLFPDDPGRNTDPAFGAADGIYNMGNPVPEDVNSLLIRAARWQLDRTKADGYRLDAVKHVPDYFFGKQFGGDKDKSSDGYLGQSQEQFNLSRGFSDWDNHRDSLFNTEQGRDDAMMFGEHLGEPPGYGGYVDAGMRLVDNPLRQEFNDRLGNPSSGLNGFDQPGWGGFSPSTTVMHAQSHDSDYAARRELQHAMYFTREGLGLLYTDGNYQAETLGESGGAFPRHSNTAFLGQWADPLVPNILYIHEQFARGTQKGRWSDSDVVIYERIDKREKEDMGDTDGVTLLFMLNDNFSAGQGRNFSTSFNSIPGGADDYLYNYSTFGGGFYKYASDIVNGSTLVPAGGYFAFSWKNPDPSDLWGGAPLEIYENGSRAGAVTVTRRDGPDGDPAFNPNGLPDDDPTDYAYDIEIPRVSDPSALKFVARVDGSARDVLFKLDAGMDLNGINHSGGDPRDNPPAISTDTFAGYEASSFVQRIYPELFAAVDTATRNTTGSLGAETYTTGGVLNEGANDKFIDSDTASFAYHDPAALVDGESFNQWDGSRLWAKVNSVGGGYKMFVYYTTDASYFPEGAGGEGIWLTKVVEMGYEAAQSGGGINWWASAAMPGDFIPGTSRYKIGVFKTGGVDDDVFPSGPNAVAKKVKMMASWETAEIDGETIQHRPHGDYGVTKTGLEEGFHIITARAFLQRDNQASIYNTFKQTFYIDGERPGGEVVFPGENDTVGGSEYGVVVRGDRSVKEVWFRITDIDANNDDVATGTDNGNGLWVEANEVTATPAIESDYPREWRLNYVNIPPSGAAKIEVVMREVSSAEMGGISSGPGFDLSETDGHYTLITRNVTAAGPNLRMFVAFPQTNGEIVDDSYVMKVHFSKSLADGLSEQALIDRFLIRIGSNEPGAVGVAQDRANYSISYNETPDFHALVFPIPNLFNDIPDYLHKIMITHDRPSPDADLMATRTVRAAPSTVPFVSITTPPELGSDGRPYEIVLPDVASPTPEDRQFLVRVATSTAVTSVDMVFEIGSGTMVPDAGNPTIEGNTKFWDFVWTGMTPGSFRFRADADTGDGGAPENSDVRNATVLFLETVASAAADPDTDDDGLGDTSEGQLTPLPNGWPVDHPNYKASPETWLNGDVHVHNAYGMTDPTSPDSDRDLLPDSLEVGWRNAALVGESFTDSGYDHDTDGGTPLLGAGNREFDWRDDNGNGVHDPGEASEAFNDGNANSKYDFGTILSADTNGDGFPNFIGDLDPPFYNTLDNEGKVPGVNSASEGGDRARRLRGSTTNPSDPDTDDDGIIDGIEDANRNGWIDGEPWTDSNSNGKFDAGEPFTDLNGDTFYNTGDGEYLPTGFDPYLGRDWPNGMMDPGERWSETDPTNPDSDGDGANDGFGEDKNGDGKLAGDLNGNRIYDVGEQWTETDPLNADTDGDGLPDGWEIANGLDPLDSGSDDRRTAAESDGNPDFGASGDPDADTFTNAQELANGTSPTAPDTGVAPPEGSIVIGPGATTTIGTVVNLNEFTDWKIDDLIVLDEYDGGGTNNQGGDLYRAGDGFDSSRDLVAFYAHDGGATADEGDGMFYFRVDMHDLRPFAEEGNLNLYVVVDSGNAASGEFALPDDIDTGTEMRWEAVVAVYSASSGCVYVDTNNTSNSTAIGQALAGFGVEPRDEGALNGFGRAHFSSELDAVEFSISRQALLDAGWNGLDAADLNYQVFTTRDGTTNSPPGAGDIGGRSDIRDSIYDDYIASDYWRDQGNIGGAGSVLRGWFGVNGSNDRGKRAKVISLVHETKAVSPGSEILPLINTGLGAGYYRPLDSHEAYGVPLTMHVTPTLATSIQWASAREGSAAAGYDNGDGPAFNERIAGLYGSGIVDLTGSTFSDHILPYFTKAYNADNVALAEDYLGDIYGKAPSANVFYTPERVLDADVLDKVSDLGFAYTFVDQMRHIQKWFGRTTALGDDGYRINEINGVKAFVIHDSASAFRFSNTDKGLAVTQRQLLNRKARSGEQAQVVTIFSDWSDFTDKAKADAYDLNLRWLASRPWIELVTPEQIANGEIDLSIPPDGAGDNWGAVNRGNSPGLVKVAKDWIDHATQENYDNWYVGSPIEESLCDRVFEIRSGFPVFDDLNENGVLDGGEVAKTFGMVASGTGVVNESWTSVTSMSNPTSGLGKLARGTAYASSLLTAFHEQSNSDLSKFSTGAYINPDTGPLKNLEGFATAAHSQARFASVFARVESWAAAPPLVTQVLEEDVDLDGEKEFLLFNSQVFALFEAQGGRMTGGWVRNPGTGKVYQVVGNFLSLPDGETEDEGTANNDGAAIGARRTSAFKDWYAVNGDTSSYVNDLYSVSPVIDGWQFVSPDGKVTKVITLADTSARIVADYSLSGGETGLFVRFGLSPNLDSLLRYGQKMLDGPTMIGSQVHVRNTGGDDTINAFVDVIDGASHNSTAADTTFGIFEPDTVNLRNQAQTQQLEIVGDAAFSVVLGLETNGTDSDNDTLPDWWERANGLDPDDDGSGNVENGPDGDPDEDGLKNSTELVVGLNAQLFDIDKYPRTAIEQDSEDGVTLTFPVKANRIYRIMYSGDLGTPSQAGPDIFITRDDPAYQWTDDGSLTDPDPDQVARRFYIVEILLP